MRQEEFNAATLQGNDPTVSGSSKADSQSPSTVDENTKALLSTLTAHATESVDEAGSGQDITLPQIYAKTLELHRFCRSLFTVHQQRSEKIENRIHNVEETLLGQIAELETRNQESAEMMEARMMQTISLLTARIEEAENARLEAEQRAADAEARTVSMRIRQDAYKEAWHSAPLTLQLKFVRELLPDDHALQNMLKEAVALEELRRRGRDLEAWLTNYPALFADAAQVLVSGVRKDVDSFEVRPVDTLATQTLYDAQAILETTLQAMGVTWIMPSPGDVIIADHEVIGEELSSQSDGCVARLSRRGLRIQGRLALPAQVTRATSIAMTAPAGHMDSTSNPSGGSLADDSEGVLRGLGSPPVTTSASMPTERVNETAIEVNDAAMRQEEICNAALDGTDVSVQAGSTKHETDDGMSDLPGWLRMLRQRTFGCDIPAVALLAEQVFALNDLPAQVMAQSAEDMVGKLLTDALHPLLSLLGLRYPEGLSDIPKEWGTVFLEVREPLLTWLTEKLGLLVLAPVRGDSFDAQIMEAVETRRTVHANEDGTISKMERVGLLWQTRPLIRAQVVRYAAGEIN